MRKAPPSLVGGRGKDVVGRCCCRCCGGGSGRRPSYLCVVVRDVCQDPAASRGACAELSFVLVSLNIATRWQTHALPPFGGVFEFHRSFKSLLWGQLALPTALVSACPTPIISIAITTLC